MNVDKISPFHNFYSAESQYVSFLYKNVNVETCPNIEVEKVFVAKSCEVSKNTIVQEIEKAREQIKSTLCGNLVASHDSSKIDELEKNQKDILALINQISDRLNKIEVTLKLGTTSISSEGAVKMGSKQESDDEVDLFGSDEEDDEVKEKLKEERIQMYNQKKSKKAVIVAKSNIILDIKPWDDETDMGEMEKFVRSIEADGLLWGSSKLVPLAYGIKKLQISCVVEDDKIGTDFLEEKITEFDSLVQSVDIAAFNKI